MPFSSKSSPCCDPKSGFYSPHIFLPVSLVSPRRTSTKSRLGHSNSQTSHHDSVMTAIPSIACLGVIGKNVTFGTVQSLILSDHIADKQQPEQPSPHNALPLRAPQCPFANTAPVLAPPSQHPRHLRIALQIQRFFWRWPLGRLWPVACDR
jgi:hypothetical protein